MNLGLDFTRALAILAGAHLLHEALGSGFARIGSGEVRVRGFALSRPFPVRGGFGMLEGYQSGRTPCAD